MLVMVLVVVGLVVMCGQGLIHVWILQLIFGLMLRIAPASASPSSFVTLLLRSAAIAPVGFAALRYVQLPLFFFACCSRSGEVELNEFLVWSCNNNNECSGLIRILPCVYRGLRAYNFGRAHPQLGALSRYGLRFPALPILMSLAYLYYFLGAVMQFVNASPLVSSPL